MHIIGPFLCCSCDDDSSFHVLWLVPVHVINSKFCILFFHSNLSSICHMLYHPNQCPSLSFSNFLHHPLYSWLKWWGCSIIPHNLLPFHFFVVFVPHIFLWDLMPKQEFSFHGVGGLAFECSCCCFHRWYCWGVVDILYSSHRLIVVMFLLRVGC